MCRLRTNLPRG
ncbi:hypothetical protein VCHC55B2_1794A, partial [Vibrio cholerae HC-55B2]